MSERPPVGPTAITDRQLEVARLVAEGQTNAEIARTLGISVDGAKYHVSELLTRLGLTRRREIVEWYASRPRRRFGGWGWWPWLAAAAGLGVAAVAVTVAFSLSGAKPAAEPAFPAPARVLAPLPEGPSRVPTGRAVVLDDRGLVPERGHTLTLLPDGTVLIAGGERLETPGGRNVSSAIVRYDPSDDSFVVAGELIEPRSGHTATLLPDGRVLFAGGDTGEFRRVAAEVGDRPVGIFGGVEIFDPATGRSTAGPRPPEVDLGDPLVPVSLLVAHMAVLEGDGQVVFAGPFGAVRFDPATMSFGDPFAAAIRAGIGGSILARSGGDLLIVRGGREAGRYTLGEVPQVEDFPPRFDRDGTADKPGLSVRDERGGGFAPFAELPFVPRLIAALSTGRLLVMALAVDEAGGLRPLDEDDERLRLFFDQQFDIEGLVRLWYTLGPSDHDVRQLGDPVPFEVATGIPQRAELVPLADGNALVVAGSRSEPCATGSPCSVRTGGVWFVDAFDGATTPIEPTIAARRRPMIVQLRDGSVLMTGLSTTTGDDPVLGSMVERYYLE